VKARASRSSPTRARWKPPKSVIQVGTRNIVDVLDAQRQLYTSVRDYNNSRYDYILDNLRLKQAAGTLSPADLQDLGAYLKADYNPDKDFLPPDLAKPPSNSWKAPAKRAASNERTARQMPGSFDGGWPQPRATRAVAGGRPASVLVARRDRSSSRSSACQADHCRPDRSARRPAAAAAAH
jgi:hypothetical protein